MNCKVEFSQRIQHEQATRKVRALLLALAVLGSAAGAAQALAAEKDRPGAKDHPLIGRYEGSILHNQGVISFEQVVLPLGPYVSNAQGMQPGKSQKAEGKVLNYAYWGPKDRSELEVFRNYQTALTKAGFTLLYVCDEPERCRADGLGKFAADLDEPAEHVQRRLRPAQPHGRERQLSAPLSGGAAQG